MTTKIVHVVVVWSC